MEKKSKIEKLVFAGDLIENELERIRIKINEIIDHLNSQDKEEENTVCEGCGKTITSRFMQSYTKGDGMHSYCLSCDPEKQDTPEQKEEWEEEFNSWFKEMFGEDYENTYFKGDLYDLVKNLLLEREQFAKEELQCVYNHIMGADVDMEEYYKVLGKIENFLGYERLILTVETGKEG